MPIDEQTAGLGAASTGARPSIVKKGTNGKSATGLPKQYEASACGSGFPGHAPSARVSSLKRINLVYSYVQPPGTGPFMIFVLGRG